MACHVHEPGAVPCEHADMPWPRTRAFWGRSAGVGHALNRGLAGVMFEHALALLVSRWHAMSLAWGPFHMNMGAFLGLGPGTFGGDV